MRGSLAGLTILGLFLIGRPYEGIVHDALLYVGRAVANLDPGGIGQDLSFASDGQSSFSLYPSALTYLTSRFGPGPAAMIATCLGLSLWLAAVAAVARGVAGGPALFAMLAIVVMMPNAYGGFDILRYGEAFAVPRNVAEAGVLAGLATLLSGRRLLAGALMLAAALVHPIMAAAGIAVLILVLCMSDRRWSALTACAAAGILTGAAIGLPVLGRLSSVYDPAWRAAIDADTYLFPSQWPTASWQRLAVNVATIGLALRFARGTFRHVLAAILLAGVGGVLATWLLGDWIAIVLVVQAQPWRALWLVSLAAALVLPLVARDLWTRNAAERAALATLAMAWIDSDLALPALAMGALLLTVSRGRPDAIGRPVVVTAWFVASAAALATEGLRAAALSHAFASIPPDGHVSFALVWRSQILALPIGAAIVAWFVGGAPRLPTAALGAAAILALGASATVLDGRTAFERRIGPGAPDPALIRLLPTGQDAILVLDRPKIAWFLGGRRNWASPLQSAGMIFSRPLAIRWRESMDKLIAWDLAPREDPARWQRYLVHPPLRPGRAGLTGVCREPGGPSALVLPLSDDLVLPDGLDYAVWTMPAPIVTFTGHEETPWVRTERFAVIVCSALTDPLSRSGASSR